MSYKEKNMSYKKIIYRLIFKKNIWHWRNIICCLSFSINYMSYKKIYMSFNIKRHIRARVIFRWGCKLAHKHCRPFSPTSKSTITSKWATVRNTLMDPNDEVAFSDPKKERNWRGNHHCSMVLCVWERVSYDASKARPVELRRCSTKSREYWHADTIPLGNTWNHMKHALVIVDDFTRMSFVYLLKDKSQYSVAAALEEHFLQQRPTSTGIQGINFFINRTILRSDRGTEFINSSVHDLCARLGCNVWYSCPGQLGSIKTVWSKGVSKKLEELHDAAKKCQVCPI